MKNNKIIISLLKSNKYLTSKELAECAECSIRTIKNNIDRIDSICNKSGLVLLRKKGKGFYIQGNNKKKESLIKIYSDKLNALSDYHDRFLYLLYLLLFEEEQKITVTEISEIFFISRQSVYQEIRKVNVFLKDYDVKIISSRISGLTLQAGEKRKRLLITKWVNMTNKRYGNRTLSQPDKYGLYKALQSSRNPKKIKFIKDLIMYIKEESKLDFSLHELDWLVDIFYYSINRTVTGHVVSLTDNRIALIKQLDDKKIIGKIIEQIQGEYQVKVLEVEAIYLYTLLIVQSTKLPKNYIQTSKNLVNEIRKYIIKMLRIDELDCELLTSSILSILTKEINYQVKNDYYGILTDYYRELESSFQISAIMSKEIFHICTKYYSIRLTEQLLCNIIFNITHILEKNKQKLKAVLIHDCNVIELVSIKEKLDKYISFIKIIDEMFEINNKIEFDIILSTKDIIMDKPVIYITKHMDHLKIDEINSKCNKIYQKVNYSRLIKNFDSIPHEVCR